MVDLSPQTPLSLGQFVSCAIAFPKHIFFGAFCASHAKKVMFQEVWFSFDSDVTGAAVQSTIYKNADRKSADDEKWRSD